MGNLNTQSWDELWHSAQADAVRRKVRQCDRNCWMIGSVSPAMHKYIWKPAWWVIRHKLKFWTRDKYSMYENKICRIIVNNFPGVTKYKDELIGCRGIVDVSMKRGQRILFHLSYNREGNSN